MGKFFVSLHIFVSPVHKMVYLQANFFENWYYPMPEKGFSFFEIQTPLEKCNPPQTKRSTITWGGQPQHLVGSELW